MTCTRHGNNLHPELPPLPDMRGVGLANGRCHDGCSHVRDLHVRLVDLGQLFCARVARLREPALTKSGYDDEMFTNTSR